MGGKRMTTPLVPELVFTVENLIDIRDGTHGRTQRGEESVEK